MSTPYLVVDEARLDANIARVADFARERGIALRPHAKTHKCVEIARRQLSAGAVGLTVATLGEAEAFAGAGVDDLFVAYPLWPSEETVRRVRALAGRVRLAIGIDGPEAAAGLAAVPDLEVLVEVDSGQRRTGVAPAQAGELARRAADLGLAVRGAFTFPGHGYAEDGPARAAGDEDSALSTAASALRDVGLEPQVLSGGSTPSLAHTGTTATELRPGVYVFGDAQQWELGTCRPEDVALTCHATVVSHAGGRVTLDAGSKVLGADRPPYASGFGRLLDHPEARIVQLSEHHAVVEMTDRPALGSLVRVVPNHVCTAVNLVDELVVGDGSWPVAARGRNS